MDESQPLEAARRLRVEITPELKAQAKSGTMRLPLPNKGYAFLGADGLVDTSDYPEGTQAIYNMDGQYMIIERK